MCFSYSGSDWESRPLQSGPALAAARDVLYLLPLQELLERAIQLPQERFTQVKTVIICFGVNVRGISKCKYTFLGSSCAMHNTNIVRMHTDTTHICMQGLGRVCVELCVYAHTL